MIYRADNRDAAGTWRIQAGPLDDGSGYWVRQTGKEGTRETTVADAQEARRVVDRWWDEINAAKRAREQGAPIPPRAPVATMRPGEGTPTAFGTYTGD
jgi:hypothetical protein